MDLPSRVAEIIMREIQGAVINPKAWLTRQSHKKLLVKNSAFTTGWMLRMTANRSKQMCCENYITHDYHGYSYVEADTYL